MSDCKPSKIREAIPDIQEWVFFSLTKVEEMMEQISRLDQALVGNLHVRQPIVDVPVEPHPDDVKGVVEVLEETTVELRQALIDAETELRTRLDLLLGQGDIKSPQ